MAMRSDDVQQFNSFIFTLQFSIQSSFPAEVVALQSLGADHFPIDRNFELISLVIPGLSPPLLHKLSHHCLLYIS